MKSKVSEIMLETQLKIYELRKDKPNIRTMCKMGACSNKTVHRFLRSKGYNYNAKTGWTKSGPSMKINRL